MQRITVAEILEDEWFKKDYKPASFDEKEEATLDDVEAVFKDSEVFLASTWIYWLLRNPYAEIYSCEKCSHIFLTCRNIT